MSNSSQPQPDHPKHTPAKARKLMERLRRARVGEMIELPARGAEGLNPPVDRGDQILTLCRVQNGYGWLCGPYKVAYLSSGLPAYRPKHAKVDKIASDWIALSQSAERR